MYKRIKETPSFSSNVQMVMRWKSVQYKNKINWPQNVKNSEGDKIDSL